MFARWIAEMLHRIKEKKNTETSHKMYIQLLQACTENKALQEGIQVHNSMTHSGHAENTRLVNHLITMYSTCRSIENARKVFDTMEGKNLFTWTSMITAYAQCGNCKTVVQLLQEMLSTSLKPDHVVYIVALSSCWGPEDLEHGRIIHELVRRSRLEYKLSIANALLNMYGRCHATEESLDMFQQMAERDNISWTTMIGILIREGNAAEAVKLAREMRLEGTKPDKVVLMSALTACAIGGFKFLKEGRCVHMCISELGVEHDEVIGSTLVNMYGRCESLDTGMHLLEKLQLENVYAWTTTVEAFACRGRTREAMNLFHRALLEGVKPDKQMLIAVANLSADLSSLSQAKHLHRVVEELGFHADLKLNNALIDMFAKCSSLLDARNLFDTVMDRDIVTWNTIIAAHARHGEELHALKLFRKMDLEPNSVTYIAVLNAWCSNMEVGEDIHRQIQKQGLKLDLPLGNALMNMYGRLGCENEAFAAFNSMEFKDVITWSSMISVYARSSHPQLAVELFHRMLQDGSSEPDKVTLASVLDACGATGALNEGRRIHKCVVEGKFDEVLVRNAVLNMYGKCGKTKEALDVFRNMKNFDVVSWNAIMGSFSNGECLSFFNNMQLIGYEPDSVTFLNLLSACSHAGLVKEACELFGFMIEGYGIVRRIDHYGCIIDLLGRRGQLQDAEDVLENMPMEASVMIWTAFLAACRNHGDVARAKYAAERVEKMNTPGYTASAFTMLSNMHAAVAGHFI